MDALAGLLDGPRARNAFLLRSVLVPPWSMRILDEAPLTLVAVVGGSAWIELDGGGSTRIGRGEVAIVCGPGHYTVADDPGTAPQIAIHPGQRCTTMDGAEVYQEMDLGVRTWGNSPDGGTVLLTGTYNFEGEVSRRLLRALPALITMTGDGPLIALLTAEIGKDDPGQELVLDRMLDLLLVHTLRAWLASPGSGAPAWYQADADPVVGRALKMIHHSPAHPWTVASLADRSGASRAVFARRFHELVGEPPMAFLTGWRLALAADLLRESDATIGSVAQQVGYGSAFALSAAFKRVRGVSPQQYRLAG
ncbi:MAG: AraC family transcriptional regulator [Streptosporangiaceae bacterium]